MRLKNKVAIVTGSGSGIGRGIARGFAEEGARVVVCGRRLQKVQEAVTELRSNGGDALGVQVDVTEEASIKELVSASVEAYGTIDVLVNNAGVRGAVGDVTALAVDEWWTALKVNLTGPLLCSRHVIPIMQKAGGGSIINIGSMRIQHVKEGAAAYCTSKGALVYLTRVMALDHAKDRIRVNLLSPALVLTEFTHYVVEGYDDPAEGIKLYGAQYPLGRIGTEEDIAKAAVYLASDESTWVTGAHLNVDGGMVAR